MWKGSECIHFSLVHLHRLPAIVMIQIVNLKRVRCRLNSVKRTKQLYEICQLLALNTTCLQRATLQILVFVHFISTFIVCAECLVVIFLTNFLGDMVLLVKRKFSNNLKVVIILPDTLFLFDTVIYSYPHV